MNNIKKTLLFLKESFDKSKILNDNPVEKSYRYHHTLRVSDIAREIAIKENLDMEVMVIAALLHDLAYKEKFENNAAWKNHGRTSAKMAEAFVQTLDLTEIQKRRILAAIEIHVDDKFENFETDRCLEVVSIIECDNIDRFDRFRNLETLINSEFKSMTNDERIEFLKDREAEIKRLKDFKFSTKTSNDMWNEKLDYQLNFTHEIKDQLLKGYIIESSILKEDTV